METFQYEYFNRKQNAVCVGTFVRVTDKSELRQDQLFIVPPFKSLNDKIRPGCSEGNSKSIGFGLPIALSINHISDNHLTANYGYGSWIKDICFVEII